MKTASDAVSALLSLRWKWERDGVGGRNEVLDKAVCYLLRKQDTETHDDAEIAKARDVMLDLRERYIKRGNVRAAGIFLRCAQMLAAELRSD